MGHALSDGRGGSIGLSCLVAPAWRQQVVQAVIGDSAFGSWRSFGPLGPVTSCHGRWVLSRPVTAAGSWHVLSGNTSRRDPPPSFTDFRAHVSDSPLSPAAPPIGRAIVAAAAASVSASVTLPADSAARRGCRPEGGSLRGQESPPSPRLPAQAVPGAARISPPYKLEPGSPQGTGSQGQPHGCQEARELGAMRWPRSRS